MHCHSNEFVLVAYGNTDGDRRCYWLLHTELVAVVCCIYGTIFCGMTKLSTRVTIVVIKWTTASTTSSTIHEFHRLLLSIIISITTTATVRIILYSIGIISIHRFDLVVRVPVLVRLQ